VYQGTDDGAPARRSAVARPDDRASAECAADAPQSRSHSRTQSRTESLKPTNGVAAPRLNGDGAAATAAEVEAAAAEVEAAAAAAVSVVGAGEGLATELREVCARMRAAATDGWTVFVSPEMAGLGTVGGLTLTLTLTRTLSLTLRLTLRA